MVGEGYAGRQPYHGSAFKAHSRVWPGGEGGLPCAYSLLRRAFFYFTNCQPGGYVQPIFRTCFLPSPQETESHGNNSPSCSSTVSSTLSFNPARCPMLNPHTERTKDPATTPATPAATPAARADPGAKHDTRVTMVQERLLEALLLSPPAPTPVPAPTPTPAEGSHGPSAQAPMDVDAGDQDQGGDESACGAAAEAAGDEALAAPKEPVSSAGERVGGGGAVPTAVQVVASMVDTALQVRGGGYRSGCAVVTLA